jgi:hypothetical protein
MGARLALWGFATNQNRINRKTLLGTKKQVVFALQAACSTRPQGDRRQENSFNAAWATNVDPREKQAGSQSERAEPGMNILYIYACKIQNMDAQSDSAWRKVTKANDKQRGVRS